jgi:hypothetical protein
MRMCVDFETFHLSEFIPLEFNLRSKKNQTINEISSRPNDSDFGYTHQWPPYLKKKLFNKSKCSPVYSSLYIRHAIAIWTKSHSRSTFFWFPPKSSSRLQSDASLRIFIEGHFSYFVHVQEKGGNIHFFLSSFCWRVSDTPRERNSKIPQ